MVNIAPPRHNHGEARGRSRPLKGGWATLYDRPAADREHSFRGWDSIIQAIGTHGTVRQAEEGVAEDQGPAADRRSRPVKSGRDSYGREAAGHLRPSDRDRH